MSKLMTLDEQIAQSLRRSEESGELQRTKGWGKPLDMNDGFDETPEELRMAFKMLKDSGFVPPEIEMMNKIAELRKKLETLDAGSEEAAALRQKIMDLRLSVSIRLESFASGNI